MVICGLFLRWTFASDDSIRSVPDVQLKFLSRMCEDILMGKQTVAHQLHNYTIQNISYNFAYTKKTKTPTSVSLVALSTFKIHELNEIKFVFICKGCISLSNTKPQNSNKINIRKPYKYYFGWTKSSLINGFRQEQSTVDVIRLFFKGMFYLRNETKRLETQREGRNVTLFFLQTQKVTFEW